MGRTEGSARSRRALAALVLAWAVALLAGASPARGDHSVLAGAWPLDGPTADGARTPDASGHGNDALLEPGTAFTPQGRFGGALDLSADLRDVRVPRAAVLEPATVTVVAWIRAAQSPGAYRYVVAKGSDGNCVDPQIPNSSWALSTRSDEGLVFTTWDGVTVSETQSPAKPAAEVFDGAWHAIAGVFDGARTRLYVDGAQVGDGSSGTASIAYGLPEASLTVGRNPAVACSGHFPGLIDAVSVYARALTAEEIAGLAAGMEIPGGPAPAAGRPPSNLERPRIVEEGGAKGTYRCTPGTWEGLAADAQLSYVWRDVLRGTVASREPTFTPRAEDYGYPFVCTVTTTNAGGSNTATSDAVFFTSAGIDTLPPPYGNVRIRGIDVFQTVQPNSGATMSGFPSGAFPAVPGGGTPTAYRPAGVGSLLTALRPQEAEYNGVILDTLKSTTAVVYVSVAGATARDPSLPLQVTLVARRGGRTLGEPLVASVRNPPRSDSVVVSAFERRRTGVRFRLPSAWLAGGDVDLEARVQFPPSALGAAFGRRECDADCSRDNAYTLRRVRLQDFPQLLIASIQLLRGSQTSLAAPGAVLGPARQLMPGGSRMTVLPYAATLNITTEAGLTAAQTPGTNPAQFTCNGQTYTAPAFTTAAAVTRACRQAAVSARVLAWATSNPARELALLFPFRVRLTERYDLLLATHDYTTASGNREPGWQNNGDITSVSLTGPTSTAPYLTVNAATRPLTAAAHELGHALSAPHADTTCGGSANGQVGEAWAPDNAGRLQGTKFVHAGSLGVSPVIVGVDDPLSPLYDFMSYCADNADTSYRNAGNAWLSARNWNRFRVRLTEFGRRVGLDPRPRAFESTAPARAAQARGSRFGVAIGVVGATSGVISRVLPAERQRTDAPDVAGSPVRLRSFDASGALLLDAGAEVLPSSELPPGSPSSFRGAVAPRAATVQLVRDGAVLSTLQRTAAPRVRILAPRAGERVRQGRGSGLVVRWTPSDPDGAELVATVEFSRDGGRNWRSVFDGPDTGSARVPAAFLEGTRTGRVRVTVSDGLARAQALSRRFRVDGRPPVVRILSPDGGEPLVAGQRVLLVGSALDDRQAPLRGRSLRWFAGRRALGRGERVRTRLRAGRTTLRLVATDRSGARGEARVRVRVQRRTLRVLSLRFPRVVASGARSVTGTIRVSAPATLVAGARRTALSSRARRVTLRLPRRPRSGLLRAPFTVRPRGRDVGGTLRIVVEVVRR